MGLCQGVTASAEFVRRLDQRQLAAVRAFQSPSRGCRVAPSKTCLHRILSELDPDALAGTVPTSAGTVELDPQAERAVRLGPPKPHRHTTPAPHRR